MRDSLDWCYQFRLYVRGLAAYLLQSLMTRAAHESGIPVWLVLLLCYSLSLLSVSPTVQRPRGAGENPASAHWHGWARATTNHWKAVGDGIECQSVDNAHGLAAVLVGANISFVETRSIPAPEAGSPETGSHIWRVFGTLAIGAVCAGVIALVTNRAIRRPHPEIRVLALVEEFQLPDQETFSALDRLGFAPPHVDADRERARRVRS
jgi:hypothetical protein